MLDVSSRLIQGDGSNEELADRQYLAVGARQVRQQALPHAGFCIICYQRTQSFQVKFCYCKV